MLICTGGAELQARKSSRRWMAVLLVTSSAIVTRLPAQTDSVAVADSVAVEAIDSAPPAVTNAPAATNAPVRDLAAARYLNTCAGCHSLSGAKLNGPELSHVATWSAEQLKAAIKRMEKNVGPLADADVTAVAGLLQSPDVRERLKLEAARIQAQFAAHLAPADAVRGRKLFHGAAPLANGGLSCVACHAVGGRGGSLGPDLTAVAGKMGEAPLASAIEQASFKVMAPHYRLHPITKQEALHMARYLSQPAAAAAAPAAVVTPGFTAVGAGAAVAIFGLVLMYYRRGRARRPGRPGPGAGGLR